MSQFRPKKALPLIKAEIAAILNAVHAQMLLLKGAQFHLYGLRALSVSAQDKGKRFLRSSLVLKRRAHPVPNCIEQTMF